MKHQHIVLIVLALTIPLSGAEAVTFATNATIEATNLTYDGLPVVVNSCTITINGPHNFASLQVISNGVVTHAAAPNGEKDNLLALSITGDLTVDSASRIDVSGCGFSAEQGPGAGGHDGGGWGSGAGHGGMGGYSNYQKPGGGAYDDILAPLQWGSGGGGGAGGAGGGAASIKVAGTLQVDGAIKADGAPSGGCCAQQGGGSGGSVLIQAGILAGNGWITADGGAGGVTGGGGGAGGGRIALYFTQNNFVGILHAAGALGYQNGGAGTIYTKAASEATGHVFVDNHGVPGLWTPLSAPEAFELIIANFGKVRAAASMTNNGLTISTNGWLAYATGVSNFTLKVLNHATIEAGGTLALSGLGYAPEQGPGAGARDSGGWGSGGGHGGVGGYSNYQQPGGGAYDSILMPTEWGSGGGSAGGSGGGAMLLQVDGILQVEGTLTADGLAAPNPQYGAGAGGSLWITVGNLSGTGSITARGGQGGVAQGGGGGGGGRIALYYMQNNFLGTISAAGGLGIQNAGAGTIYFKSLMETAGHVLVANDGASGEWTPLTTPEAFELVIRDQAKVRALAPLTNSGVTIQTNGLLSSSAGMANLSVTVYGNLGIDAGGSIDVNGLGFSAEQGPGAGSHDGGGWGSGGGHGGIGGNSYWQKPGGTGYDSIVTPSQWGSGGGTSNHNGGSGGNGGGAVVLNVAGTLRIDGSLTAEGMPSPNEQYGSGAGGSLWINAKALTGGGWLSARGGIGGITQGGGGGGGGRIALYYTQNTFTGSISAAGGLGFQNGGAGTIYTKLSVDPGGQVLVDNAGNAGLTRLYSSGWPAELVFDLTLSGAAIVKPDAPQTFRNLVMTNGTGASHDQAQSGFFWTCLGDARIASNASFNVDGLGYTTASGPGYGTNSVYGYGSGGGHGGAGAASYNGGGWGSAPGGVTNGSSREPVTLGSGGGGGAGASGGGAIRLTVKGTLYLNGTISANGLDASGASGGGAGGSVWITAKALTGGGSVQANGGATAPYGAAGGGGRIAIYALDRASYSGTASVSGASAGSLFNSVPPMIMAATPQGSSLRLAWPSAVGTQYQAKISIDLQNWSDYGDIIPGTGKEIHLDIPTSLSQAFFQMTATTP